MKMISQQRIWLLIQILRSVYHRPRHRLILSRHWISRMNTSISGISSNRFHRKVHRIPRRILHVHPLFHVNHRRPIPSVHTPMPIRTFVLVSIEHVFDDGNATDVVDKDISEESVLIYLHNKIIDISISSDECTRS